MSNTIQSRFARLATQAQTYWLYLVLLAGDVVLVYAAKVLPVGYGLFGVGTLAIAFFGQLAHDLTQADTPANTPHWITYLVITVAAAFIGAVGFVTDQTFVTLSAFMGWFVVVLQYVYHAVAGDAGTNAPTYVETAVTLFTGAAIAFLAWYSQNPDAAAGAVIATLIAVVTSYVHVTAEGVTVSPPSGSAAPAA